MAEPSMTALNVPLSILSRIVGAVLGGYAFTSGFIALSAVLFVRVGLMRSEAVVLASMLGFLIYLTVLLWAFAVRNLSMLWGSTVIGGLLMGALALLLRPAI